MRAGRLTRGDWIALGFLVGLPLFVLAIPAALGYPLLTGDEVIQNYPLRVLAGEIIRHGHLPVYDPFDWGGTPLLASSNSGSLYPDIVLFAVFPPLVAWVAAEVAAFAGAAVGLYAFLRFGGLRPLSAAVGGAAFGLGGFVTSQAVHLDVLETAASIAWVLVAVERVTHGPDRHRLAWTALLGAATAATLLAGSPETAVYAALGAVIYACPAWWHSGRRSATAAHLAVGGGAGALVGAVQILPTARFVAVSQRSHVAYSFLTSGSLRLDQLPLLLAPHILGGGPIGLAPYVGSYNLAEIDAYPGILALIAVVALAWRWRSPQASRIRIWYLIGAAGLVIAVGSATPLPHLLARLPILDDSRLPSRALLLVALASSVLYAHWVAEVLDPGSVLPVARPPGPGSWRLRLERSSALAVPGAILLLLATVAIGGKTVARAFTRGGLGPWTVARVAPYLVVAALVALAAAWFLVFGPGLVRRRRVAALVALAVVDLVVFLANQSSLAPVRASELGQPSRLERELAAAVGKHGRFLVVDHLRRGGAELNEIGAPNLNVFTGLASVQGYGSLTWGPYAQATGTHGQNRAAPGAFSTGVFDSLDVRALLVLPWAFESRVTPANPGVVRIARATPTTRYFGGAVDVTSVRIAGGRGWPPSALGAEARGIRLLGMHRQGAPARVVVGAREATAYFRPGLRSFGLVLPAAGTAPRSVAVEVARPGGRPFSPTGLLAATVTPPHWRIAGSLGVYLLLTDTRAYGPLTTFAPSGTRRLAADVRVVSSSPWTPAETVEVDTARPVLLVRGVADLPGWQATVTSGGRVERVRLRRYGVVQAVELAAGRSVVTFRYQPPGLSTALALAAVGCALLAALGLVDLRLARRRRTPT
ncbi:MAG: hypothetical protein ABSA31_02955 [Acidimicrobiales bacterium]